MIGKCRNCCGLQKVSDSTLHSVAKNFEIDVSVDRKLIRLFSKQFSCTNVCLVLRESLICHHDAGVVGAMSTSLHHYVQIQTSVVIFS